MVSHKRISYKAHNAMPLVASASGIVSLVEKTDNWGVEEYKIEIEHSNHFKSIYKGLHKAMVSEKDTVFQLDTIAITGDNRLYPIVSFQLLKNKKAVNPASYFSK